MSGKSHTPDGAWAAPHRVEDVGAFVSAVRRGAGLTQAQLADRAGVGRRFVNELETGHSTLFVDRLAAVLRELGIRVVLETGPAERAATAEGHAAIRLTATAEGETSPPVKDLGW